MEEQVLEFRPGKKKLRENKWNHAQEVYCYFKKLNLDVFAFECMATPHLRIDGHVDYWPATMRFYNAKTREWNIGWQNLKNHFQKKMQNKEKLS